MAEESVYICLSVVPAPRCDIVHSIVESSDDLLLCVIVEPVQRPMEVCCFGHRGVDWLSGEGRRTAEAASRGSRSVLYLDEVF